MGHCQAVIYSCQKCINTVPLQHEESVFHLFFLPWLQNTKRFSFNPSCIQQHMYCTMMFLVCFYFSPCYALAQLQMLSNFGFDSLETSAPSRHVSASLGFVHEMLSLCMNLWDCTHQAFISFSSVQVLVLANHSLLTSFP